MSAVRVKICGVTRLEDALLAVRLGADALGFNFWPRSKRFLAPAAVQGTIKTPKLIIEEGVTFDGKSEMAGESQTPDQKAVPLADR